MPPPIAAISALDTAARQADDADSALRRELHFYTLYRLLEASMLVLVLFGPVADMIEAPRHELMGRAVAISYLFLAVVLFLFGRRGELGGQAQTIAAVNDARHLSRVKLVQPDVVIAPQVLGAELAAMLLSGEAVTPEFIMQRVFQRSATDKTAGASTGNPAIPPVGEPGH